MFSLLIAEDEILERRMLEKIITKECPDIDRLMLAEHGLEALEMVRLYHPDILLVDINMPGMSGIELIHTLRKEAFGGQIIILTAYSDFVYAQQAIDNDVIGYLLKPVDVNELCRQLDKCIQKITQHTRWHQQADDNQRKLRRLTTYVRPQLMREMLSGVVPELSLRAICDWPQEDALQCTVLWARFDAPLPKETYTTILQEKLRTYDEYFMLVNIWEGENLFIVLQPLQPMVLERMYILLWMLAKRFAQSTLAQTVPDVFVSQVSSTYEALRDTLARKATFFPCSDRMPQVLLPSLRAISVKEHAVREKKALLRMQAGDPVRVLSLFSRLLADPSLCWAGVYVFVDAYQQYDDTDGLVDLVSQLDVPHAVKAVRAFLEHALGTSTDSEQENVIIDRALSLMQKHFASPAFSQAWLAEELGLSQAYFSRLFRKALDISFIAKLTEIRMEKALYLLGQGSSIQDVATSCGYQSVKYFTTAFRQYHGFSAQAYRKNEKMDGDASI